MQIKSGAVYIVVITAFVIICNCTSKHAASDAKIPIRIISLAPSITETLFELGLGSKVIGVTSYCKYPDSAKNVEKIGGYADANLEKIVSLHPDLVIGTTEHVVQREYLEKVGVKVVTVNFTSIDSICSAFLRIGKSCNVDSNATNLVSKFRTSISQFDSIPLSKRPSVLLCVGRSNPGEGVIRSVYIAGKSTVYSEIIDAAGGKNAFTDRTPAYPKLSPEGIIFLNPDIIIDFASAMNNYSCGELMKDWYGMKSVDAVSKNNIFCIDKNYATVPGPRILLLIDDLKTIIRNTSVSSVTK